LIVTIGLCKELKNNIFDSLDLAELSRFGEAAPNFHADLDQYIQRRRLVIFAWFTNNIDKFIGLLQSTGAVISGSSALNMVQARQGAVEINDFDVYTALSKFGEFIHCFMDIEGYRVIGDFHCPPPGPYNTSGIAKLFRLQKCEQNVDIIVTNLSSAVSPVIQFHNTVVMNFISAEAVFCAYPQWMLGMVGLVHPRMYKQNATNLATIKGLAKYLKRGIGLYLDIELLNLCLMSHNVSKHSTARI
jgi:hypothetical protein